MTYFANAIDIYKKTDLISRVGLQSSSWNISCVIANSYFTQGSDGRKPNWLGFDSFVLQCFKDYFLKIFSKESFFQERYCLVVFN